MIDHFTADIATAQDYYPFGMPMPGRTFTAGTSTNYRYGFNGKENDNEVKGVGDQIDYGMRVYDPRGGRFLSVDPLRQQFPWLTPYQFASNSPEANVDVDGKEAKYFNQMYYVDYSSRGVIQAIGCYQVEEKARETGAVVNFIASFSSEGSKTGVAYHITNTISTVIRTVSITQKLEDLGAFYYAGPDDKKRSGLYLTSKSEEWDHSSGDLSDEDQEPIAIETLVNAVGGFPDNESAIKAAKEIFTSEKLSEASLAVLETIKNLHGAMERIEQINEALKEIAENLKKDKTDSISPSNPRYQSPFIAPALSYQLPPTIKSSLGGDSNTNSAKKYVDEWNKYYIKIEAAIRAHYQVDYLSS